MNISVARTLPEDKWQQFLDENPAANVFHTPEMFQVFSRAKNYHPELWAATRDKRILALFLPVQVALVDGLLRPFTTRSVAYGSVLYDESAAGHEALARLLKAYRHEAGRGPLFTELRNMSELKTVQQILSTEGFIYEDYLNYLIELNGHAETVLQNMGRRTRKHIRRGLRKGDVIVKEAKERNQVHVCYELLRQSYRAARIPLADLSLFEAAYEILQPKDMIRFTLAYVNQTPAAASVELLYKDTIYGWYGGLDRAFSSHTPNELLMWDILRWGTENGYSWYDFGGAGKPEEAYGVRDFKSKFGGDLVCYGRNTIVHAPARLWLSKQGYNLLRRWL